MGTQIAAWRPYATRSGGERSSKLAEMSCTTVALPRSITAPTMPCPFWNSSALTADGKPSDMITD